MENSEFVEELDALFDKERQAIFDGGFDELGLILAKKNQMIEQIPTLGFSKRAVEGVLQKAKRNQDLLAAAVRGVRMVSNRLNTIRKDTGRLNTYDKSGKTIELNAKGRALEWRA